MDASSKKVVRPVEGSSASRTSSLTQGSTSHALEKEKTVVEAKEGKLAPASSEPEYPPTSRVLPIMGAVFLVQFLVALDRLIIATAIPKITDQFNSLGDVAWYANAYMLTACAFAFLWGRIYTFYNPKWVYICAVIVFEVGSAVCGAAPNSNALIVGRAIAGLGGSGLFSGNIIIVFSILPLHKRPAYTGFFGMVFGVASVVGPLVGGAFTDSPTLTWRWCFYINLPIGGAVLLILIFLLKLQAPVAKQATSIKDKISRLDPIGTLFFLPSVVCLLLALQWGGLNYSWSNARIIVLFVLFGVLLIAFIITQHFKGENGTIPPHIFLNRSVLSGSWYSFCTGGSLMTVIYYLPIYFQAIHNTSAVRSGILTLPLVFGLVATSITAGILTRKTGYYVPWMIAGAVLSPIAIGLITTYNVNTGLGPWVGYQLLAGLGVGFGMQAPNVAAQTVLSRKDIATGASLMFFSMQLGGTVFISIANNVFDSKLASGLTGISGVDAQNIVNIGATDLRQVVSPSALPQVLVAYNAALRYTFYIALGISCASIIGALTVEWKSVKQGAPGQNRGNAPKQETGKITTEVPKQEV